MSFRCDNGNHAINISFKRKEVDLKKKCTFILLLGNDKLLSFFVTKEPIKNDYDKSRSECLINIDSSDIEQIRDFGINEWRIVNSLGTILSSGMNNCCSMPLESNFDLRNRCNFLVLNNFLNKYIELSKEIKVIKDDISNYDSKQESSCYVYLMIDTTNNFHKIGISNKPKYRERTLQSEKPTIELVCAKEYPSRAIAEAIEEGLHKSFSKKRMRGEWFRLDDNDVKQIKETLK